MKIRTQLFLTNGGVLALLAIIAALMHQSTQSLISTSQWVTHTNKVIVSDNLLAKGMAKWSSRDLKLVRLTTYINR